jgi:hypothetical protein
MKCEYQPDGYTASINNTMKHNPSGYCLYYAQRIDMVKTFFERLAMAGRYLAFRRFSKNAVKYNGTHNALVFLSAPVGAAFWIYYKLIRGF